jgi:hypothetical protein
VQPAGPVRRAHDGRVLLEQRARALRLVEEDAAAHLISLCELSQRELRVEPTRLVELHRVAHLGERAGPVRPLQELVALPLRLLEHRVAAPAVLMPTVGLNDGVPPERFVEFELIGGVGDVDWRVEGGRVPRSFGACDAHVHPGQRAQVGVVQTAGCTDRTVGVGVGVGVGVAGNRLVPGRTGVHGRLWRVRRRALWAQPATEQAACTCRRGHGRRRGLRLRRPRGWRGGRRRRRGRDGAHGEALAGVAEGSELRVAQPGRAPLAQPTQALEEAACGSPAAWVEHRRRVEPELSHEPLQREDVFGGEPEADELAGALLLHGRLHLLPIGHLLLERVVQFRPRLGRARHGRSGRSCRLRLWSRGGSTLSDIDNLAIEADRRRTPQWLRRAAIHGRVRHRRLAGRGLMTRSAPGRDCRAGPNVVV